MVSTFFSGEKNRWGNPCRDSGFQTPTVHAADGLIYEVKAFSFHAGGNLLPKETAKSSTSRFCGDIIFLEILRNLTEVLKYEKEIRN